MRQIFLAPLKLIIQCSIVLFGVQHYLYQRLTQSMSRRIKRNDYSSHPYHCVEIKPAIFEDTGLNSEADNNRQPKACSSVIKLAGQRYLSDEAPGLPLPDCICKKCTCYYKHYEDRRTSNRRSYDAIHRQLYCQPGLNKRMQNERRVSA